MASKAERRRKKQRTRMNKEIRKAFAVPARRFRQESFSIYHEIEKLQRKSADTFKRHYLGILCQPDLPIAEPEEQQRLKERGACAIDQEVGLVALGVRRPGARGILCDW